MDNLSTDGSPEIFKKEYTDHPKISLILNQENIGFTKANNAIFKLVLNQKTTPTYIALLNNDTVVEPDWLNNLVSSAQKYDAAIVSSKMIDYFDRARMDNAGHLMLNTGEILPIGHNDLIEKYDKVFENIGACAGACLYESSMLEKIGIFDEYFVTGYEDAEFGVRATMSGYKCIFEPSAIVYHKMGQSIKKVFNYRYAVEIQKKVLFTYLKLMPIGSLIVNLPFVLFRYLAIILVQIIFWRPIYIKIVFQSIKEVLVDDFEKVKLARKHYRQHQQLSSLAITRKQTFFLTNNLKRFYHYFIQKKQSAFDAYGKKELI